MKILLGSKNPAKKNAVDMALTKLGIQDYNIISVDVPSNTSSKPIGYEIIRGAENRNLALREYALENEIDYDYLCSIEGGYSIDENGLPFVVTYCVSEDKFGKKSTGKSLGIRLSKTMFDYIKSGGSLNKVIEEILGNSNNKQHLGITGYLTNGLYNREYVDSEAVISAFISFVYSKQREELDEHIKRRIRNKVG